MYSYNVQGFYNKQKSIEGFTNSYSFPKLFEGYDIPTETQQTSGRTGTTVATNGTTVTTTGTTVTTTEPQGQQGQGLQGQQGQGPQGQGSQGQGQQGQGSQGGGQQGQGQQGQSPQGQQGQGQQGQSSQGQQGQGQQGQGPQGGGQQGQGQEQQGQGRQEQGQQGQGQGRQGQQGQGQGQQGAQGQGQGQGRQGQQGQGQGQQISSIINNILNNSLFTGYISDLVSNKFTELNNSQQNTNKIINMKTYNLKDPEVFIINDETKANSYNEESSKILRVFYKPKLEKSHILFEISSYYDISGTHNDKFECEINVSEDKNHYTDSKGGKRIAIRQIRFEKQIGGGARSGSFFPSGIFKNNNTKPKYFHFNVKREGSDDSFKLARGKNSDFLEVEGLIKITEIRED
mgnify:CR=1 FL=1